MELQHPINITSWLPADFGHHYWHVIMTSVVVLIVLLMGLTARRLTNEIPTKGQNFFELLVKGVYSMGEDIMGPDGRPYVPFFLGIGLYVALSNLIGLVPGFLAPTSVMNTTAAPAICVFLFYQYIGFKRHGAHYIHHFMGPIAWLAPLMFIIELIGHFARPLSLTMRLFGNIAGEDLVIAILFFLVPYLVPMPMMFLGTFTSLLQAYVFMMLSMIYVSGALEEAH